MAYKDIEPKEFEELMKKGHQVIDVRPAAELVEGEIEGYQTIDFFDPAFRDHIDSLDRDQTYLLYCRSGNRSGRACQIMESMGFESIYNLAGGILAWNDYRMS